MAASVVQEATPVFSNTPVASLSISLSGTANHNLLDAFFGANDAGGFSITSAVDTQGNVWAISPPNTASGGNLTTWRLIAPNIVGGVGSNTLVITPNYPPSYCFAMMKEIQGVSPNPLDGIPVMNYQATPGVGAGAITTGLVSNVNQPALVSAFAVSIFVVGSTLTADNGPGLSSQAVGTVGVCASGSVRVTATGVNAATFTQNFARATIASLAIFDEAVAGAYSLAAETGFFNLFGSSAGRDLAMQADEGSFGLTGFATGSPPTFTVNPTSKSVIQGASVSFSAVAIGAGITLQWYRNGSAIPGATGPTYSFSPATVLNDNGAQFYTIATNIAGAVRSATAILNVSPVVTPPPPPPLSHQVQPLMTVSESITLWFDFISKLVPGDRISTATFGVTVYSGIDPNPSNILVGVPSVIGTRVSQAFSGGVAGVIYLVTCRITSIAGATPALTSYVADLLEVVSP
jgi:hypothetical protein